MGVQLGLGERGTPFRHLAVLVLPHHRSPATASPAAVSRHVRCHAAGVYLRRDVGRTRSGSARVHRSGPRARCAAPLPDSDPGAVEETVPAARAELCCGPAGIAAATGVSAAR
jgi:hypothetical protein